METAARLSSPTCRSEAECSLLDDSGNVFAHGAVIHLQRSRENGATWAELTVPVRSNNNQWTATTRGGRLTVGGSDGQVYSSADGGDNFTKAALPTGTMLDFASYGQNLYAVMSNGALQVLVNARRVTAANVPSDAAPTGSVRDTS